MKPQLHIATNTNVTSVIGDAAELFVVVDAAYPHLFWWKPVRDHGTKGALKLLDKNWYQIATAHVNGTLVGFAGLDEIHDNETELTRVMTHPEHTSQNIATQCIQALLDITDQNDLTVWLEVLSHDMRAQQIYRRLEFEVSGERRGTHPISHIIQMRREPPTITTDQG